RHWRRRRFSRTQFPGLTLPFHGGGGRSSGCRGRSQKDRLYPVGLRYLQLEEGEPPGEQHLYGDGEYLRHDDFEQPAACGICRGHDHRRLRSRPRLVGNGLDLVGLTAVADRSFSPAGNARPADEAFWLETAER